MTEHQVPLCVGRFSPNTLNKRIHRNGWKAEADMTIELSQGFALGTLVKAYKNTSLDKIASS